MMEDMHDYGVYANAVDIVFDEEELDDSDVEEDHHANKKNVHQSRNLTETQRQQIYAALLERNDHGRLKRKATTIVAQIFQVSRYRVQHIWQRAKQYRAQGIPVDVRSRKPKRSGRKKLQIDLSAVLCVPLHRRSTIRSLATAIGVNKSTVYRWFKKGLL
jgi:predicted transcriptional regulator YheO